MGAHRAGRRFRRREVPSWMVILTYVLVTMTFGAVLPRLESSYLPNLTLGLSVSSALTVCGAIASGMLALTGIVFSLSFVMVQFSSAAYSPRLVQWFAKDPVVTHATGIFTATFLYALMTSAWIDRQGNGQVPFLSGMVVFLLLLASVFAFTGLVHRIGMLQISNVLAYVGDRGREIIADMYPPLEDATGVLRPPEPKPAGPWVQVLTYKGPPQVVAALDVPGLVAAARSAGGLVVVRFAVGSTVMEGDVLARVSGNSPVPERDLLACIHLTQERTFEQDPKYALRLLVDVAIKALSPAINDPDHRRPGPRPAGGSPPQARGMQARRGPREGCVGGAAPGLPRPHVGGLPAPRLRGDPRLRRRLRPGHAAHEGGRRTPSWPSFRKPARRPCGPPSRGWTPRSGAPTRIPTSAPTRSRETARGWGSPLRRRAGTEGWIIRNSESGNWI